MPLVGGIAPIHAALLNVDTTTDDAALTVCDDATTNDCSLRGAIIKANGLSEASTINVPAGTYVLTQGTDCTFKGAQIGTNVFNTTALCLAGNITLIGAGADRTIIDANQPPGETFALAPIMFVGNNAPVEIQGVTMKRGNFTAGSLFGQGGGINNAGTLTLADCVVSDNTSGNGGGIFNSGTLSMLRTTVTRNVADEGGGIINASTTVTISDSVISNNTALRNAGGIENFFGIVIITGSTISGNLCGGGGGGIANFGGNFQGVLRVTNTTISGNQASIGGGISNWSLSTSILENATIAANSASNLGGGLYNNDVGAVELQNTIIAGNVGGPFGPDCFAFAPRQGALISQGYNLIQDTSNCDITGDTTGNITAQDPKLGVLADNGGPTPTQALGNGSPAIDAGNPAAPGSGGFACTAIDQRGIPRPQGARCDMGAYETFQGVSLLVLPDHGGNSGSVVTIVYGLDVAEGSTVKLARAGQPDIPGDPIAVAGPSILGTNFDLTGQQAGVLDVVVNKPGGPSATIPGGFTIEDTRAPQLWVDVIGRTVVRVGRPAPFTIVFGNRGNVDAVAVPLLLTIPASVAQALGFQVTPPPPNPQQVPTDWSQVPVAPQIDGLTYVPLLLPVVPAGFTGTLELRVTAPQATLDTLLEIDAQIGPSLLDPQGVDRLVEGARIYAQQTLGVTIPDSLVPQLQQYVTTQIGNAVARGRNAVVAGAGTSTQVYSLPQLVVDAAKFGAAHTTASAPSTARPIRVVSHDPGTSQASPQQTSHQMKPGTTASLTSVAGSFLLHLAASIAHGIVAFLFEPNEAYAATFSQCAEKGLLLDPKTQQCTSCIGAVCNGAGSPFTPRASHDPNDKVGSHGEGTAQFLIGAEPLRYSIFFENVETAMLPAQKVVITDQLDRGKLDLDTFSLGPISFGNTTVLPTPGLSKYAGSVDLRPAQDLLVGIDASLDKTTGVVTWRFTSVDPLTLQLPDNPLVGFLPPNKNPPEGEGYVLFTVMPRAGLSTGTQIMNQAQVVFDVNPPINTPQWLNTMDSSKPASAVSPLAPTQSSASFLIQWSGTDTGSGISAFTIVVSDNGGSFNPFISNATDTSATFNGQQGHTYGFYSIAADLVGNVEDGKTVPDTTTQVVTSVPQLTALSPAKVWVGLKNSDDVGTNVDLRAEAYKNGALVGSGQLNGVSGGSSGFNHARMDSIDLTLPASVDMPSGSILSLKLSVRITCSGKTHNSGTARLWFNDGQANSRFDATIGGTTSNYYLLNGSALGTTAGPGPKKTIDVFVDNKVACPGRPFKPFGTWSITLP